MLISISYVIISAARVRRAANRRLFIDECRASILQSMALMPPIYGAQVIRQMPSYALALNLLFYGYLIFRYAT